MFSIRKYLRLTNHMIDVMVTLGVSAVGAIIWITTLSTLFWIEEYFRYGGP